MDPVTVLGFVASIVQLIGATTAAIGYLNDVKDAPKDRATLAREGSSLLVLFTDLRYRVEEADSTDAWFAGVRSLGVKGGPVDQFKDTMEELAKKLKPEAGMKKFGKALIWTLNKNEISSILSKIERLKTIVSLALQNDHFKLGQAIKQDIDGMKDDMRKDQKDKETQNVINWISPLNFHTKQNDFFGRRQRGTGEWLLREKAFISWLDGTRKTLWCPGLPGAGKTILASNVVNHLDQHFKDNDAATAYIYCSYKEGEHQTAVNLIASLLQQLIQRNSIIPDDVMSLYHRHILKQTRPTLDELSTCLQSEVRRISKVFIIIDALDECPESNYTRENFLAEIRKLQPTIHLMVTSRHIPAIEREFEQAEQVEIRASSEDVKKYLISRIESEGRLVRLIKADSALQTDIVNTVVANAKGMFLLAQLQMDSLAKKHNRRDIRKALENLPKELDEIYDEAMLRISSQDRDDAKLAERVLCWISFALRPLTIIEVQHAIAAESGDDDFDEDALSDEDVLVSVCAGLVTIDQQSKIIRLVHYTTQEYFERIRANLFPAAQTSIAMACVVYISFGVFGEGYCRNDEEMEIRMHQYPFLEYATRYWGDHARGDPEEVIIERAIKFLMHESKVACFNQARHFAKFPYRNYGQKFPRNVNGLHLVATIGLMKIARLLVERENVDIDPRDSNDRTPLSWAAEAGHEAVVKMLLEKGADLETKSNYGQTPLSWAAGKGHESVVKLLLEKDAKLDTKDKDYGQTPLSWAAEKGHEAVVKLLLEKNADLETKSNYGQTPLSWAARKGHESVVKLLLEKDAKLDTKDKDYGQTPLSWAAEEGHEAIVKLLLEKGAELETKDSNGRTPLSWAAVRGREAVVKLLLEKGADLESKDKFGQTPLVLATKGRHEEIVKLLLEKGAQNHDNLQL